MKAADAETDEVEAVGRPEAAPVGRAAAVGIVVPRAAAQGFPRLSPTKADHTEADAAVGKGGVAVEAESGAVVLG
jgi:hypothetical protein